MENDSSSSSLKDYQWDSFSILRGNNSKRQRRFGHFPLSQEGICVKCLEFDEQSANTIRENFVFPLFLTAHYDGKIRQAWGVKSDYLALCVLCVQKRSFWEMFHSPKEQVSIWPTPPAKCFGTGESPLNV